MSTAPSRGLPSHPKLRPLEPQVVEVQGRRLLHLRDPLGLTDKAVLVPQELAPLLALCDGTRDIGGLQAGFALRTGMTLSRTRIAELLEGLDGALVFENGSFERASAEALRAYREADHREPSHADLVYPSDPDALGAKLDEYQARAPATAGAPPPSAVLAGVVSPHIDYSRGWETYTRLWQRCAPALDDVELAIVLGTDHSGRPGSITPTRQSYATPLGVLPTERRIVDGLADALGPDRAFAEELHHVNEHSIELAVVWFHHLIGGRPCPLVPVLCGSFERFVTDKADASQEEAVETAVGFLREAMAGRRTLVVAAGDLAHVGPAFGDPTPVDRLASATLAAQDARSIEAICAGDAEAFLALSRAERDSRKLCGLPPIYLALRLLDGAKGESLGYAQCPADASGGSLVSIAGVALWEG